MAKYAVLKSFYASEEWITLRLLLINERGTRCEHCKQNIPRSKDLIGHHKIELTPENVHDRSISLNPDLIELICFDCHNEEHNRFGKQSGREVYLVYGPPMAGKAAFVREQMKRGDIVVDMDRLYAAVSGLLYYDKPDNLFAIVIGMQNLLLDNIRTRYGKWNNAWIIGGYADKYKRERLADDLVAELIYCKASMEECIQRLEQDEDRRYRQDEWRGYIEKWFEQYHE